MGETNCTGNGTELVYEGYVIGSHHTHAGAAVNYLYLFQEIQIGVVMTILYKKEVSFMAGSMNLIREVHHQTSLISKLLF